MKTFDELKQQLKKKEQEIKALKYLSGCPDINEMVRKVIYRDEQIAKQYDFFQNQLKTNTHQVCEKIRRVAKRVDYKVPANIITYTIYEHDLDQIEKEEI